jgi:hypothetical protein
MGQGFSKHVVLVFDGDLEYQGQGLIGKAELKNLAADATHVKHLFNFTNECARQKEYMTQQRSLLKQVGIDGETKITLLSHGYEDPDEAAPEGAKFYIGRQKIIPHSMAMLLRIMLNETLIKRVSIFACYGGGNKAKLFSKPGQPVKRQPDQSFGFEFARLAGKIAQSVTARTQGVNSIVQLANSTDPNKVAYKYVYQSVGALPTDHHITQYKTKNGQQIAPPEKIKRNDKGRYHDPTDKVVFKPNAESDVKKPIDPTWAFEQYAT